MNKKKIKMPNNIIETRAFEENCIYLEILEAENIKRSLAEKNITKECFERVKKHIANKIK